MRAEPPTGWRHAGRPRSPFRYWLIPLLLPTGLLLLAALHAPAALAGNGGFGPVQPESPNAGDIRTSYIFVSIFVVAIFVLVEALLIAFIVRYRRRRRPRFEDGAPIHGATNLELLWTAFPVVVLFLIAAFIFVKLPGIADIPSAGASGRLEVKLIGRQFYWQFEYPNGVVSIDTLRVPVGVPVVLDVTAPDDDVIHSWWIPALGGKKDAIPGLVNKTWFEAKRIGVYTGQCAELCGLEHATMRAAVVVLPKRDFERWLAVTRRQQTAGTSDLGDQEWGGVCAKCHGMYGEGGIGPRLANSPILSDRKSIETLVRNGRRTMPAVAAGWTGEQLDALLRFLKQHPPTGTPSGG